MRIGFIGLGRMGFPMARNLIKAVVIIGDFTDNSKKKITELFPSDWKIAIVSVAEMDAELADAEVIIPEHIMVDGPFLDRAKKLRLIQTAA